MKAVVAAFNQEKALVGAFSVITNLRMQLFEALVVTHSAAEISRVEGGLDSLEGGEAGGCREPIKYFDIYRERPVRLTVRALVPVKEHPKVIN